MAKKCNSINSRSRFPTYPIDDLIIYGNCIIFPFFVVFQFLRRKLRQAGEILERAIRCRRSLASYFIRKENLFDVSFLYKSISSAKESPTPFRIHFFTHLREFLSSFFELVPRCELFRSIGEKMHPSGEPEAANG